MGRGKIGAKVVEHSVTFDEWMKGENAIRFATRQQVVAYSQFQLQEQILPLMAQSIQAYDRARRQAVWHRRLRRWLRQRLGRLTHEEIMDKVRQAQQEVQQDTEEMKQSARERAGEVVGGIGRPADNGEPRRSCVTCGSFQLEPVNQRGGLQCDQGHILEEPPEEPSP